MSEELITLVIAMREAQKEFDEKYTRQRMMDRVKYERMVDAWIQKHIADCVQLELWSRSAKSSETPGVYNVLDESETEESGGA